MWLIEMEVEVKAPGKVMIAGEWAVLERQPCIVAAVDKYVKAGVEDADCIIVDLPDFDVRGKKAVFNGETIWETGYVSNYEKDRFVFTEKAIETTLKYLHQKGVKVKGFHLVTESDKSFVKTSADRIEKIGFGSSAAATAAVVAALLTFHGIDLKKKENKLLTFKLACIAHYLAQERVGSGFDIAAAVYGGLIWYRKFDDEWLRKGLEKGMTIAKIVLANWKGLEIEPLKTPKDFRLCICYSGNSASTTELVKIMGNFKTGKLAVYDGLMKNIGKVVERLRQAMRKGDKGKVVEMVKENRKLLLELGRYSGLLLETNELRMIADLAEKNGAAGKFSGAGGGDCGIAVCFDERVEQDIREDWRRNGFGVVEAQIDEGGVQ